MRSTVCKYTRTHTHTQVCLYQVAHGLTRTSAQFAIIETGVTGQPQHLVHLCVEHALFLDVKRQNVQCHLPLAKILQGQRHRQLYRLFNGNLTFEKLNLAYGHGVCRSFHFDSAAPLCVSNVCMHACIVCARRTRGVMDTLNAPHIFPSTHSLSVPLSLQRDHGLT